MLDSETRRKIDTLRDILVGKIPNPQTQVEQITTGLIYKFMDDMDKESLEMGGEGSFFVGDYEKYAWDNLLDPKLSGVEKVKLYSDAIEGMYLNPSAPQLFREMFRNAFLPFKDPSTLNMFLKEINEFHYSHSEKLGDAFEYLISIMGSQGDAGQFRTPRHIIDFIVDIVDPEKNETILDPACGTAGFLISSYKHILENNTDKNLGDQLSAEDKKKVGENITGYDISPEMIRLSLVNMYLHGFSTPKIDEYDTLSSEDKWNEYFDVILANPPFFSPKGGIQPHKRFGVDSKKAEVLFTSYILEHLKPKGRAGIIVPEGIIFQTGTAYKELRKQLVEKALVGIISLPAGVFQPYSGVKTSILILDKELNQKSDSIFFGKVENDGFSLGAQRTSISKNDLPKVSEQFQHFCDDTTESTETVSKQVILESADTSFSLSKFQTVEVISNFDMVKLKELVDVLDTKRKPLKKADRVEGIYPYYGATGVIDYVNDYIFEEQLVLIGEDGAKWGTGETSAFIADGQYWVNNHAHVVRPKRDKLLDIYLTNVINFMDLNSFITGVTVPKLNQANLLDIEIPLPPIEVQQQIVDELEGYQKIIDGCRQVVENYKPTIDIDPSWEMVELGKVCKTSSGGTPLKSNKKFYDGGVIPWMTSGEVNQGIITKIKQTITQEGLDNSSAKIFDVNTVCVAMYGATVGKVGLLKVQSSTNQAVCGIFPGSDYLPEFLYYILRSKEEEMISRSVGGAQPNISQTIIKSLKIPIIPLVEQQTVVERISEIYKFIEGNKRLMEIYTQKIHDRINKVWGE